MEDITKLQKLIEMALEEYTTLSGYPNGGTYQSEKIKSYRKSRLEKKQADFIEGGFTNDGNYIKSEIDKIEAKFSISAYTCNYTIHQSNDPQKKKVIQRYKYSFDAIKTDLPKGKIKSSKDIVIIDLLATIDYYYWLKEKQNDLEMEDTSTLPKSTSNYLIWNGSKNTLADIFFQLKTIQVTDSKGDQQPILDASNSDLAVFIKNNFECFKNTKTKTIEGYFEKEEKRPKKGKNKLTISKGFTSD